MTRLENPNEKTTLQSPTEKGPRPYHPPRLIEYGSVEELTQSGFGPGNDGQGPSTYPTF